ncbi:MAG: fimbrial biogenesis chaperone [Nitritalea sp.]
MLVSKLLIRACFLVGFVLCSHFPLVAQVSIAPTSVFLDQSGVGSLFLSNTADEPMEVTVSFQFGYPYYDENGEMRMRYEEATDQVLALDNNVRAFPRALVLPPRQQQTVRVMARPPASAGDGLYFTRVKVSSVPQAAEVGEQAADEIVTQLSFRFDQVIPVFYKRGNPEIKLSFENEAVELDVAARNLKLRQSFQVEGPAPFLGSMRVQLRDASDALLHEFASTQALYFSGTRNVNIPLPESLTLNSAGDYRVVVQLESQRSDMERKQIVQLAQPLVFEHPVQLR